MKLILINILIGLISVFGFSQQAVVGAGGDAKSFAGSFSYSVGQLIVSQVNPGANLWGDEAITINHGVQQYFIPNCFTNNNTEIIASPNPSRGLVNISLLNWDEIDVSLAISEISGRNIMTKILKAKKTSLELSHLSSGVYFLTITNNCGALTSFKLIIDKK
ncbi:MAG: T9SS type A sorting domain-containing protein [Flavobacteriales bacterium]|jgi:hypothetical protein|tara:strand:- start:767 stop:1252 length:486 start_codon:yes stop_codon:yes gene_type:complete